MHRPESCFPAANADRNVPGQHGTKGFSLTFLTGITPKRRSSHGLGSEREAVSESASPCPGDDQFVRGPRQADVEQVAIVDFVSAQKITAVNSSPLPAWTVASRTHG